MLRKTRRALDITQDQLAARLGVSREYVSLIETGKAPCPSYLLAGLAKALGQDQQTLRQNLEVSEIERRI